MQNTKLMQQSAYINRLFDEMIPDGFQDDHDSLLPHFHHQEFFP